MCVLVFFFKQKTAYEMRISDWSSDVCSSDLIAVRGDLLRLLRQHAVQRARQFEAAEIEGLAAAHVDLAGDSALDHVDRKSVVSGKSVSVRVDLGGRRIMKNKILSYKSN